MNDITPGVAEAMDRCLRANDQEEPCGFHHTTNRPTGGGGFWCCCGRYWAHRLRCCNDFPTFSVAGDPVTPSKSAEFRAAAEAAQAETERA